MASTYICIFCQRHMRTLDEWTGHGHALCERCGVTRTNHRYVMKRMYKGQFFEFIWDMIDQAFILRDANGEDVMKASFDIAVTPQNALKKLPSLIVFS